jgi:hypothetical protein
MGFRFVQMKGIALLQGEIITKGKKCTDFLKTVFFSRTRRPN